MSCSLFQPSIVAFIVPLDQREAGGSAVFILAFDLTYLGVWASAAEEGLEFRVTKLVFISWPATSM